MKIPFKCKLYIRILLFQIKSIFKEPLKNQCTRCGNLHLLSFSSLRYKKCLDCNYILVWPLKENEKPLIKHQR